MFQSGKILVCQIEPIVGVTITMIRPRCRASSPFGGTDREDKAGQCIAHLFADDGAAIDVLNGGHSVASSDLMQRPTLPAQDACPVERAGFIERSGLGLELSGPCRHLPSSGMVIGW